MFWLAGRHLFPDYKNTNELNLQKNMMEDMKKGVEAIK